MDIDAAKDTVKSLAANKPVEFILALALVFVVWINARAMGEIANQLKARNFMIGMEKCETPECVDKFLETFAAWMDLRKAGCE